MPSPMSPYDMTWGTTFTGSGGTAINAVSGDWTRRIEVTKWPDINFDQFVKPDVEQAGSRDVSTHRPAATMLEFNIWYDYTAQTLVAGTEAVQDANHDIWQDAQALFKPFDGEKFLFIRRQNAAAANVDRVCLAKPYMIPGAGEGTPGFGPTMFMHGVKFPVRLSMLYPFFWEATEVSDTTSSVGASPGTATVDVDTEAAWKCGARFTVANRSGDITKLLIANTTYGYEFTVEAATRFTDGDYIDIRHADKHGNTAPLSTVNASGFRVNAGGEAKASFWLHPGAQTLTVTRIAGSGTLDIVCKHQAPFGTV